MINNEYMDGSVGIDMDVVLNEYNSFMESCDNEISNMFADFNMMHEKVMLESEIMDTVPEDMMIVYESEKKNIFTKIGEMIVTLFKKIKELIDKGIEKLKELSFKNKTIMQKAEVFAKKHPEFKNEILESIKSGALDLNDMKSLKELEAAYDEIIKLSKKKDIDPKTLRGKWEKLKEKFDSDSISKKADATNKVITVGVALAFFIPNILKAVNEMNDLKKKTKDQEVYALETLRELQRTEPSVKTADGGSNTKIDLDNIGKAQLILQMSRIMNGKITQVMGNTTSIFSKLADVIAQKTDKFLDRGGKKATEYIRNLDFHKTQKDKEHRAKIDEEIDIATKKAEARPKNNN